jgi:hypothetical protein
VAPATPDESTPQRTTSRSTTDAAAAADAYAAPRKAPPTSPTEWAQRWLDAIRARDLESLGTLSAYPFHFDDTGAVVGCAPGAAMGYEQLEAAVRCLFVDDLLTGALKANPEPAFELKKGRTLPSWAKRWRKDVHAEDAVVATEFGDNGISYYFGFAVTSDGVRAVYRHASFWPN